MTNALFAGVFVVLAVTAFTAGRRRLQKGPRRVPLEPATEELELLERWPRVYFAFSLIASAVFLILAVVLLARLL